VTALPFLLVFDVNETLLDIESLSPVFERIFGDPAALREWFNQLVMYSMAATMSGHYVDFPSLGQGVFQMAANARRLTVTDDDLRDLKHGMLTMPAHPDVADGLTALRNNGFRLVTLTNSPLNPDGPTALEHAGLADFFEQTFSVESCRAFKPAPSVYRHVCDELAVAPADCMMVAAHVWDIIGAQSAGFSGALITRPGTTELPIGDLPQPDLVASDLRDLAQQLTDRAHQTSTG
jgi:2-haloacid dehalogenase